MPYMFTVKHGLQLLLLYYTGLLPFVALGESFLQFYLPQIFNTYVCVISQDHFSIRINSLVIHSVHILFVYFKCMHGVSRLHYISGHVMHYSI